MVFLLSTISQYLTKSDLSLLREQLTSAGIDSKAVYLVGTQKDLVFRMDADLLKKPSFWLCSIHKIKTRS